jgi:hypothetical protein
MGVAASNMHSMPLYHCVAAACLYMLLHSHARSEDSALCGTRLAQQRHRTVQSRSPPIVHPSTMSVCSC